MPSDKKISSQWSYKAGTTVCCSGISQSIKRGKRVTHFSCNAYMMYVFMEELGAEDTSANID